MTRSLQTAELIAAVAITLLGAWVLWQASELREGPGYAAVGPRVFPIIVGLGLLGSGLALVWEGFRGRRSSADDETGAAVPPTDWATLGGMAALLAGYVFLFQPLGFIIATALFMPAGGWALGSRAPPRDVVAGILLGLVTYVVFTRLLGLELPAGPLEAPLRALATG